MLRCSEPILASLAPFAIWQSSTVHKVRFFVMASSSNPETFLCLAERFAEAEPLYVKALQILERTVGSKHPLLGISTHMFASFLVDAGKVAEAKPFYERALKIKVRLTSTLAQIWLTFSNFRVVALERSIENMV